MARASVSTLLSLDRFAALASLHPLHFNQLYANLAEPNTADVQFCDHALMQHSWQAQGGVSREEIALAIAAAEMDIKNFTGYSVAPEYFDKLINPVRPSRADGSTNIVLLNLPDGYVQTGGFRNTALIKAGAAVTYSDSDSDGYSETATCTSTVAVPTGTLPEEIHIVYPDKSVDDPTWHILPTSVTIDDITGVATVVTRRERLVKETLLESMNPQAQDGLDNANFVTTIDLYRVYTDPSVQVSFLFNSGCSSCLWGPFGGDCTACGYSETEGCLRVVNQRVGQVQANIASWDVTAQGFTSCVDEVGCGGLAKVRAQYVAGYPLEIVNGVAKMQTRLELAVTRLAMAKLDRPMCECETVQATFAYWNQDLASTTNDAGSVNTRLLAPSLLESDFGTTRGGLWVFGLLRNDRVPVKR